MWFGGIRRILKTINRQIMIWDIIIKRQICIMAGCVTAKIVRKCICINMTKIHQNRCIMLLYMVDMMCFPGLLMWAE